MAIIYQKEDGLALITISRPEARNCLDRADMDELGKAWLEFRDDPELRVAIITGAGDRAFCTGADLGDLIPGFNSGQVPISPTMPAFLKNIQCFKPIIAAVNGVCLAGGLEMLQGTDIRIAVSEATFGLPEVQLGLFPAAGSTVRMVRQIPYCCAMEMLLTGEPIAAQQALAMGLINRVVPRPALMDTARRIAGRLLKNGPLAVRAIKESVLRSLDLTVEGGYFLEAFIAGDVFGSQDASEGPRAFMEKRQPVFQGR